MSPSLRRGHWGDRGRREGLGSREEPMASEQLAAVLQAPPRRFRPYPQYKNPGVSWVGEMPHHWNVARVADHSDLINGFPFDSDLFSRDEGMPLVRIRDLDSTETEVRYAGLIVDVALI